MGRAPSAARRHIDLARIGLGVRDELGNRLGRDRWMDGHDKRLADDGCDRRDVADEIEIEFVVERRVDRVEATDPKFDFRESNDCVAQKATTTIPIVFSAVGDPVGTGLVSNLARPGGNVTGLSVLATELAAKRLEILEEIAPHVSPLGMFWNDTNPSMVLSAHQSQDAAAKLGLTIQSIGVHDLISFDSAFAVVESGRVAALLTLIDPFTREYRQRIVDFAAQRHLPAIYDAREFVQSGGLISYGPSLLAMQQRVAEYVDKIFKGAKPGDLPVEQPTKFELVINLKAAKALGITVPQTLLVAADEVIQ
jgi:putative ABC transport system substrate-binding protein